jgi:hypothetical protein
VSGFVQQGSVSAVTSGGATPSITGVTSGNTLICVWAIDGAVSIGVPTDSSGQTWTIRIQTGAGSFNQGCAIAYLLNANAGTHNLTWPSSSGHTQVAQISEWNGITAVGGTGQASSATTSTSLTTASYTPGSSSEVVIAVVSENGSASNDGIKCNTTGFQTIGTGSDAGSHSCIALEQNGASTNAIEGNAQIISSASALTCSWSWTPSEVCAYAIAGFTYNASGGDTGGETICYFEDDVEGSVEAPDITGEDTSIFDFFGSAEPLPPNTAMAASLIELPQAFEYEDSTLDVDGEDFYWATGPPIPDTAMAATIFGQWPWEAEEPDDEDFGFVAFVIGTEGTVSNLIGAEYYPAESEEPEDEDLVDPFSFLVGTEGLDTGGESTVYVPDVDDDDEQTSAGSFGFAIPGDDTAEWPIYFPDDALDIDDDEDYGGSTFLVGTEQGADTGGEAICYTPDDTLEDEETSNGSFGFAIPPDDTGQTTATWPDDPDEPPDDEPYGSAGEFLVGTEVSNTAQIALYYFPDESPDPEDDEDYGQGSFIVGTETAPAAPVLNPVVESEDEDGDELDTGSKFDYQLPLDDTGQTVIYCPDEPEEPEEEAFGLEAFTIGTEAGPDTGGEAIVYCPDQDLDDPEPETYGTFAKWQSPADDTGVSAIYFQDEPEEPDDEQFGFEGFLVGTEGVVTTPYIPGAEAYPAEAEEPEDEDFGFASLFQLPGDDTGSTRAYEPDEAEEPEDEPFDWTDAPRPADFVAPQPLAIWQFPDEAEEQEDEPFDFALAPLAANDAGEALLLLEDEPEEPDDEDYGYLSFLIPTDALPNLATCYWPDEAEEAEDEDFFLADSQIPQNAVSICPPQNTWHEPARVRNFQEPARRRVWHI